MNYVIFDIDGTLTNTKEVDDDCFIEAFDRCFKIDIANEQWELIKHVTDWGITNEIIQREWGRVPSDSELRLMEDTHVKMLTNRQVRTPDMFTEVEGAKEYFRSIMERRDCAVGIATGAWRRSALIKLGAIGIDPSSIPFSNSDIHISRKQITKDVINQIRLDSGIAPSKIIYYGDGEWDFSTSLELGIEFVGIDVASNGKLNRLGAKNVFRNYGEVINGFSI